ncbi:tetratricopeptide repeat protein [Azospirillum sp. TSO35-2]|uniref:tetratricopeptide repeat protein n=1 Tax=Azospirillum sp. TSO35-2 TaxID=716796 RepID=UPI000D60E82C|nr:tetratricopeptide repeat protein [Azospirillum sp. TSO35-2]PWC40143.1 hypothetical protein TSO352_01425 [Azospirillum sp. TSO35-2]
MTTTSPPVPQPEPEPTLVSAGQRLADTPGDAAAWIARAVALARAGDHAGVARGHRRALAVQPTSGDAWSGLGAALSAQGRHRPALAAIRRALALDPAHGHAAFHLTTALLRAGDFDACRIALERLIHLQPAVRSHPWGRAQLRLHEGDYERGFADYEARCWLPDYARYRIHRGPRWDGGPLDGKIVMITLEQGFGDTLMMARYLPMLKARGARRVIVECRDELRRLFAGMEGVDAFIAENAAPTPIYHVHSPLMSLPLRFGTTAATVPPPVRLAIPDEARAKAARLVPGPGGARKVGIVWSGNSAFPDNRFRAVGLDRFLPLLEVPGVTLFSLQKGPLEAELDRLGPAAPIVPLGPHLEDFADTAAVLERLDLVIMTDSSVAHLAGSLGTPVWNLVQHVPYWVYGRSGPTTPWYPSMRLYRQGADEDWAPVFEAVRRDLTDLAARHRG